MLLADVALPVSIATAFSYSIPPALAREVTPGMRVVCSFRRQRLSGVVVRVHEGEPPRGVKPLGSVLPGTLPLELVGFLSELAAYYFAPIGEVVRLALPPVDRETAEAENVNLPLFGEKKGLGAPKRQEASATMESHAAEAKLPPKARAILAHLRANGPAAIVTLEARWRSAREPVKRLVDLGVVRVADVPRRADPFFTEPAPRDTPPELNTDQARAVDVLLAAIDAGAGTYLLHGVTGSGKTEVYLRLIARALELRRGVVVLVPEISLTPQLVARFRARFGDDVAVIHSGLTARERHTMWTRLERGELTVAIGARSALFAPVRGLGLVIVDEEHDASFKQEEGVRYHARDMAILRAHRRGALCVLGSATPSLEAEHLAATGKATKLELPLRARAQPMPAVEIVDLKRFGAGPTGDRRITVPLFRALEDTLARGEQAILFLNRRGFAPSVRCEACGHLAACPNCSVALTFHKQARASAPGSRGAEVRCHYCDHVEPLHASCGACGARSLALEGLGTEKLEESLAAAFPAARIARLDRDVASGKDVEKVLDRVRAREVDVLVGTQMVTKGHDLPHVTLVGVINADAALSIPDFRAAERAFQLLVQVAGRAGRGDRPGRVIVQTYDPTHHAIVHALRHDTKGFVARELIDRKELGYPPYSKVALLRVDAIDERAARDAAIAIATAVRRAVGGRIDVLGPAPAPIARVRNRHRFRTMLRATDRRLLRAGVAAAIEAAARLPRTVQASVDVDPVQLL